MKASLWCVFAYQVVLTVLGLNPASADTVYSAPHPVPLQQPWNTWASTSATNGTSAITYDSFEVYETVLVTHVEWVGCYIDQSQSMNVPPTPLTTSWQINFHHIASNGNPAAQVHSVTIPVAQVTSTFISNETFPDTHGNEPVVRRKYSAQLPTPLQLEPAVYMFSPRSVQPAFEPHFSWMNSANVEGTCIQVSNVETGSPQNIKRSGSRAFTISGHAPPTEPIIELVVGGTGVPHGGSYAATATNQGSERTIQVTILNPDSAYLQGLAASITPAGNTDFRIGQQPASTLGPEDEGSFTVIFSPQGMGNRTGTLRLTSDDPFGPYIVQLSGEGGDSLPPVISPQASALTIVDGAPGNSTTVSNWLQAHGGASATDNSGSVTWTHNFTALPPNAASTTVTFTARDATGNQATTNAAITVLDQTPPSITTPPADLQVICDDPDRNAQITAWLASQGGAAATDNSGSLTWSHNYSIPPGPCGNLTVTFTAKDAANNQSTTTAKIFVLDVTPPVVGNQAVDLTVESNGAGNASERNAWLNAHGGATAGDGCSAVTWTHSFTSLANNLPQTVPVTFTARDSCSNPSTTTANFIIQDTTPPQITMAATDYYGDQHEAAADIAAFLSSRGGAQAVDIAGPITWSHNFNGTPPGVGGYASVTFTATDTVGLSASTTCRLFLFPAGAVWTGPADSFWSIPQNWRSPGSSLPHSSQDCYVDLFNFQNTRTTINGNYGVKNLYIGAGDELDLDGTLTVFGSLIRNDGIYRSHRVTDLDGGTHALWLNGPVSLEGSGKLILNNTGRNTIYYTNEAGTNGILTVGAQQEIKTEGATYGGYQGTSIHAGLFNHGTVSADGGGLNLYSLPKANRGTFRAINGGYMEVQAPVDNVGGTIQAGAGSTVVLQNGITGGTITGTGTMLVNGTSGFTGPMLLDSGLNVALQRWPLNLAGTITNNGLIQFGLPNDELTPAIHINGPVTLDGTGKVKFQGTGRRQILAAVNGNTDILTIGAQQELTTDHLTTSNYQASSIHAGIVNNGTVTANQGQLSLYNIPKTNRGVLRAINGGFLNMEAAVDNTGATLSLDPSSVARLANELKGGTVTGGGKIVINSNCGLTGPMTLAAGNTTALDGGTTWLNGTITNNGLMTFGSATADTTAFMALVGPVTLQGSGKLRFQNGGRLQIYPNTDAATEILTVGPQMEITTNANTQGGYQRASIHAGAVNHGTITADQGNLHFYSQPKVNHGVMRAINGGFLHLDANVDNTGATFFSGPGSTIYADRTITGGTITGTGELLFGSTGDLVGPITLDAGLTTNLTGQGLGLTGDITLNGTLNIGSDTSTNGVGLYINGPVNLQGSGKVVFRNYGTRQILYGGGTNHMLTVGPNIEITTDGRNQSNYQAASIHAPFTNHGTFTVNGGGFTIYTGLKTNHGTFRVINGGYLEFVGTNLTNYNPTTDTLTGGRWEVVSSGTASIMNFGNAPVVTIAPATTVRLSGANATFAALSSLANMAGTLALENGKTLATSGHMAIPGVLEYGLPPALETTRLAVTGNMNFTGTTINVRDMGLTSGSYLLASWTGTVTGMPTLGSRPPRSQHTLVLDPVAKTLRLQVTVVPQPTVTSFSTSIVTDAGPNFGKRHVHLAAQGVANINYRVQASEELDIWVPVSAPISSPTGTLVWDYYQDPGFPRRFYRFEPELNP